MNKSDNAKVTLKGKLHIFCSENYEGLMETPLTSVFQSLH